SRVAQRLFSRYCAAPAARPHDRVLADADPLPGVRRAELCRASPRVQSAARPRRALSRRAVRGTAAALRASPGVVGRLLRGRLGWSAAVSAVPPVVRRSPLKDSL